MGTVPAIQASSGLTDEKILAQMDRIVQSEAFRNSRVLQRLLRFLADKYISGEAQQLKEYTVAVEALGRPSTYDPRHESAVRIQVGRLRQKLAEYYRTEGSGEEIIIDLPKGRFQLSFELRQPVSEAAQRRSMASIGQILVYAALAISTVWGTYATVMFKREHQKNASTRVILSPAIEQLWQPFFTTNHRIIIVFEDLLFLRLRFHPGDRSLLFRDTTVNEWSQVDNSPNVKAIRSALKNSRVDPDQSLTMASEVVSSFLLGKLLGTRQQNISMVKSSQISWRELSDENVVYVGSSPFFDVSSVGMPLVPQLVQVRSGVQNLKPGLGEPEIFLDQNGPGGADDGELYVVVTHIPGKLGSSDILSFTSSRSPGFLGAVEWFTNPNLAQTLVEKIKKTPSGELPRYYQILFKVKFKDGVSTQTSYVLHRELHLPDKSTVVER